MSEDSKPRELGNSSITIQGDPSKLFGELAKAQAEFEQVPRAAAGQVGTRHFKYADYAMLVKCIRPALSKYGIAFIQPLHSDGDLAVSTLILGGHGAFMATSFTFKRDPNPQEFGRQHTYYRRYQLQATMGIEGDDDVDAPKPKESKESTGFSEQKATPANGTSLKDAKVAPLAQVAEDTKNGKKPSVTPPAPAAAKPTQADIEAVNQLLDRAAAQLEWGMKDMRAFYLEHFDKNYAGKLKELPLIAKRAFHAKLVELKGVEPF